MILSDRTIREEIDAGRIVIDPFDPACVQPSSVDLHVDAEFRVFANSRYPYIDVKQEQPDLTELVETKPDEPFILHPGEFVLGSTLERVALPDDLVARLEGKSSLGRLGLLIHSTAGYVDPGLERLPHARALQRGEPADHALPRHEDRSDLLLPTDDGRRRSLRGFGQQVPGPAWPHRESLLRGLPRLTSLARDPPTRAPRRREPAPRPSGRPSSRLASGW